MKITHLTLTALLLGSLLLFTAFQSFESETWKEKVDEALLQKVEEEGKADFLIYLSERADLRQANTFKTKEEKGQWVFEQLKETAEKSQKEIIQFLEAENLEYQSFYIVNAISTKGGITLVEQLARMEEVATIVGNARFKIDEPVQSPEKNNPINIEWGIEKIFANQAWELGVEGQGVVVGGQDTGYEWYHPAIQEKYRGWDGNTADHNYNWHDAIHELNPLHNDTLPDPNPCGLNSVVPCDDHNHGTHTMGTMVGRVDSNYIGVAPAAKWIGCRNMDRGWGQTSTYIECFEWFLAPTDLNNENPDPSKAPHVIANSWSCPEIEGCNPGNFGLMQTAVDNLNAAGVFVVVSAGNQGGGGCETVDRPAAIFENSFAVGASNQVDTLAWFSSRGPVTVDGSNRMKPNVVAPGVSVRSCIRNGSYATWAGTSMAGPHVAGVVALMISANPDLAGDVDQIKSILEMTTNPAYDETECGGVSPTTFPNNSVGYGRVNALDAVMEAMSLSTSIETLTGNENVRIFPNPFQASIQINFGNLSGEQDIRFFDVNGRVLHQLRRTVSSNEVLTLELPKWPSGVYFYRIQQGEKAVGGRLVKFK